VSGVSSGCDGVGLTAEPGEGPAEDVLEAARSALERWRAGSSVVTVVAVDGPGAAGKSTIAACLAARVELSLVHTDDFFVPATQAGEPRRALADYYDLDRLRAEALEPLRSGNDAVFQSFDWDSGALSPGKVRIAPKDLVIVEGVCSGAPQLADLVDKAIYVDTPEPERLRRLRCLVAPGDWDERWLRAERKYFAVMRPPGSFDLVVCGTGLGPAPS